MALARTRMADDPGGSVICAWPSRTFSVALRLVLPASRYLTWMDFAFEVASRVTALDPDADDVTDSVAVDFDVAVGTLAAVGALGPVAAGVAETVSDESPEVVAPAGRPAISRAPVSAIAANIRLDRTRTSPMPLRKGSSPTSRLDSYCTRGVLAGPCPDRVPHRGTELPGPACRCRARMKRRGPREPHVVGVGVPGVGVHCPSLPTGERQAVASMRWTTAKGPGQRRRLEAMLSKPPAAAASTREGAWVSNLPHQSGRS